VLNERYGTGFTTAGEFFREQVRADASADEEVRNTGGTNPLDNFAYVFDPKLEEIVMNRMDRNSDQAVKFMENAEIRSFITRLMRDQVYDRIQSDLKNRAAPQN
jgi:type I restriction enzyme R subunit